MYAKYQEAVDALRHEQLGRRESEAVLQRVLYELEQKAGVILDERGKNLIDINLNALLLQCLMLHLLARAKLILVSGRFSSN